MVERKLHSECPLPSWNSVPYQVLSCLFCPLRLGAELYIELYTASQTCADASPGLLIFFLLWATLFWYGVFLRFLCVWVGWFFGVVVVFACFVVVLVVDCFSPQSNITSRNFLFSSRLKKCPFSRESLTSCCSQYQTCYRRRKWSSKVLEGALSWPGCLQRDGCCAVFVPALEACTELQTSMGLRYTHCRFEKLFCEVFLKFSLSTISFHESFFDFLVWFFCRAFFSPQYSPWCNYSGFSLQQHPRAPCAGWPLMCLKGKEYDPVLNFIFSC